jgi:glycine dehydrogenase subunit 2
MNLIFEESRKGRFAVDFPGLDVPRKEGLIDKELMRDKVDLPELSEMQIVRHYTELSRRNFGVDLGFYPLGSCTMKYNPKVNEDVSRLPGFDIHPFFPDELSQGNLRLIYELEKDLCEITGLSAATLQPSAGAHGELTGLMIIKAHFDRLGEKRKYVLIPDSAHGTNPASVAMCGFEVKNVRSNSEGLIDMEDLKAKVDTDVAGLMVTNPNTLGLFEKNILEIADILHKNGSLVYMDGANLNAMLGIIRPGDIGVDILHINLHKSFSTPHGGGGPGAGPVAVCENLVKFLPVPRVIKEGDRYVSDYSGSDSIGMVRTFFGNFGVLIKAFTYIKSIGTEGLREVGEVSILNANYMKEKLKKHYHLAYDRPCQHEFVLSDKDMPNHVTTSDIAKRLLDHGFHAPTIYFPLIVHGAIMIEPTETESKETMDLFIETMVKIKDEAEKTPETVLSAPLSLPVKRLDAVYAARNPILKWEG